MENKTFARNLKLLRALLMVVLGKEVYQEHLATEWGVTVQSIRRWERGMLPSRLRVEFIARYFSERLGFTITPEELLNVDLKELIEIRRKQQGGRDGNPEQDVSPDPETVL